MIFSLTYPRGRKHTVTFTVTDNGISIQQYGSLDRLVTTQTGRETYRHLLNSGYLPS